MKAIFLSITILLVVMDCHAQAPDNPVELRLQLLEKKGAGQMTLDVQVINHSAKDIFIPYISYLNFHLYRQTDTGWTELALYEHYPYKPGQHTAYQPAGRENDITRSYKGEINTTLLWRKKIVDSFYTHDPVGQKAPASLHALEKGLAPVFLKAGETLNHEKLVALDDLKPGNYKVSYGNEDWDVKSFGKASEQLMLLPEKVFSYSRYIPKKPWSNTLYYAIID
jgi:hypothetical protein